MEIDYGHGTTDPVVTPYLMEIREDVNLHQYLLGDECKIEKGDVGDMHSVLLTRGNQVYHFGNISNSGYGSVKTKPTLVTRDKIGIGNDTYIERVIAGYNTTVVFCLC